MAKPDFLDEIIEERTKENPDFPELLEAASRRRELLRSKATIEIDPRPLPRH